MFVHRCDRCCVYLKEIQPSRPKYRGIWAICMHKMMFPFQSCNSVSKCSFREFHPFSVIAENHWPYLRCLVTHDWYHYKVFLLCSWVLENSWQVPKTLPWSGTYENHLWCA